VASASRIRTSARFGEFSPSLHQGSRRLPRRLSLAPHFCREQRAVVEMRPNTVKQFRITLRIKVLSHAGEISGEFGLTVSLGARRALGDHVSPAVEVEQGTVIRTKRPRSAAVEVAVPQRGARPVRVGVTISSMATRFEPGIAGAAVLAQTE